MCFFSKTPPSVIISILHNNPNNYDCLVVFLQMHKKKAFFDVLYIQKFIKLVRMGKKCSKKF